jgi:nardilysin
MLSFSLLQEEEDGMDMCTRLAAVLHLFPPEHVIVSEYLHQHYDPQLVGVRV